MRTFQSGTYLEWCSTRRSQGTYRNNKLYLRSFIDGIGIRMPIAKLRPLHVSQWMDANPSWTDTTRNDAISIAQRPFNWAGGTEAVMFQFSVADGFVDRPFRKVETLGDFFDGHHCGPLHEQSSSVVPSCRRPIGLIGLLPNPCVCVVERQPHDRDVIAAEACGFGPVVAVAKQSVKGHGVTGAGTGLLAKDASDNQAEANFVGGLDFHGD